MSEQAPDPTTEGPEGTAPAEDASPEKKLQESEANRRLVEEDPGVQKVLEDASSESPWTTPDDTPDGREA
jgi:hypothetical protein